MSWSQYTWSMVKSGHVTLAGIYGLDGKTWSASEGLEVTPEQIQTLVRAIDTEADADLLPVEDIHIGSTKYACWRHGKKWILCVCVCVCACVSLDRKCPSPQCFPSMFNSLKSSYNSHTHMYICTRLPLCLHM